MKKEMYQTNSSRHLAHDTSYRLITGGLIETGSDGTLDFFFFPSKRNPEPVKACQHGKRHFKLSRSKLVLKSHQQRNVFQCQRSGFTKLQINVCYLETMIHKTMRYISMLESKIKKMFFKQCNILLIVLID